MKKSLTAIAVTMLMSASAWAITAENECTSGSTSISGNPSRCSGEVCVQAFRLRPTTAVVTKTNGFGASSDCDQPRIIEVVDEGWSSRVTKVCASFSAKSRSGMGHIGERGTVRCQLSVDHMDQ